MKIKMSKSQWNQIGEQSGWVKKADTHVVQFSKRGDQLLGISDWIVTTFADPKNATPENLHKLVGYGQQIGIIGKEVNANKINIPGVRPKE